MSDRRLEDRIRELCVKVIKAREIDFDPAIAELQAALREHAARLRKLVAEKLNRPDGESVERRKD